MQKIYLILVIVNLVNLVNANIGVSPTYKNLEIKTGEQGTASFTFSNGGDSPLEVILSSTANFIKPEIEKITIEPKKGKLVNFIISPLENGEYSAMVKASTIASSSQGGGMGVSQEIKAELNIEIDEKFKSNVQTTIFNEENIKCGNGICENPFEAYPNCPEDCEKRDENFNPLKYIYYIIPTILIISLVIIFIKKR